MSNHKISVLLPTRGRREVMVESVKGLVEKAADPSRLEIMLGVDEDDEGIKDYIHDNLSEYLEEKKVDCRAKVFPPLGYSKLHHYVNTLASHATGEWLFFWNDDGIMVTEGWDDVIDSYTGQFKLLAPRDNHNGHPYAIFPVVPRDWVMLMGHLSQNAQNDAWLSHIAYMLDIFERIDVEFIHDRADITGNNDDETFRNREYKEGNPEDPEDFGHPTQQQARVATTHKIAWFLDKIGQPSQMWEDIKQGKVQPLSNMIWPEDVRGAGQLPEIKKPPTDETISL